MTAVKGRGMSVGRGLCDSPNAQVLRRPAEAGLIQRFGNLATSEMKSVSTNALCFEFGRSNMKQPSIKQEDKKSQKSTFDVEVNEVCQSLLKLDFNTKVDFDPLTEKMKSLCISAGDLVQCVEFLFNFALKSKWNAHVTAIFCNAIGDISAGETKFRTQLLRKLQAVYNDKNKKYLEIDSFLMDAIFLFEIYHHVRINGVYLKILARPAIDYFGMLVDGTSQKEIEVFFDQFPKLYHSLKVNDGDGLTTLICKLRKQVICESSNIVVRAMMVEMFEKVLTDFKPLSDNARNLYESFSKPVVKICD